MDHLTWLRRVRPRLSYANLLSTTALFIALGGASYAATTLPRDSVGASQLKPDAVTPTKVAPSTVRLFTGREGPRGTRGPLGAKGPLGIQGPAGAQGPQGSQGPLGLQGATGSSGVTNLIIVTAQKTITAGTATTAADSTVTATCPSGARATGGSAEASEGTGLFSVEARPDPASSGATPTGWQAFIMANNQSSFTPTDDVVIVAYAICAS